MEILIDHLVKNYGKKTALNNINMNIGTGMFGLLGANGAGKTTLILSINKPNEKAIPVSSKIEDSYVKYMHFV